MTGYRRIIGLFVGLFIIFLLAGAGSVSAQENLDMGKSGAQLFASDCAICHKSPRGLSNVGGIFGVENFLREHYTASRQSAGAVAAYLRAVDAAQPPAERKRPARKRKREPKAASDTKPAESKSSDKSADKKPAEDKDKDKGTQANAASKPEPEAESKVETKPEAKSETKPEAKPAPASDKKPD